MNAKIFRLIFSQRLQMQVPVGEQRCACGKSTAGGAAPARCLPHPRLKLLALGLAAVFSGPSLALPANPTVGDGSATFSQSGNTLTVTNTPNAIINWGSFSIGQNEITKFVQESASSAVLNRVTGQDPSRILGALQSNGRVFLINPNGIVFGQGSTIDTAGLVASTLNLSDADFLAGKQRYAGSGSEGKVDNQGTITAASGGFVYLIAPTVENSGIIRSPNGAVLLAAGHSVEVADGLNPALRVLLTAPENQVLNLGQIFAAGGRIGLHGGIVANAGSIDASSAVAEGGKIYLRATQKIELADTSRIHADGSAGGEVIAMVSSGGGVTGELSGNGEISARGNGTAHSGGFVETSAAHLTLNDIRVVTKGGTWLIDPNDFTIAASGGDISGAALAAALAGNDVIVQTTVGTASCTGATCGAGSTGNGDIFVNDAVSWNSAQTLTLSAYRNININQSITAGNASGKLALEYGQGAVAAGNTATYDINAPVNLQAGNNFSTKLGSDGGINTFTVVTGLGIEGDTSTNTLQGIANNLAGLYVLGSDIDAAPTATWNPDGNGGFLGFSRIGNNQSFDQFTRFRGQFDGLGHTVSNLTLNQPGNNYVGLFGVNSGLIKNISLANAAVTGNASVGTLVGVNMGLIQHAHGSGTVTGNNNLGGLAGAINGGTITHSSASTTVSGGGLAGGLVGFNQGSIHYSYATGNVSSTGTAGGLVGNSSGQSFAATVTNSYATGSVNGTTAGGLIGSNTSFASVDSSYATGSVSGPSPGGLIGFWNGGSVTNSYWDIETSGVGSSAAGIGRTTAQMKQQATFTGLDFSNVWAIDSGATISYPYLRGNEQIPHPGTAFAGPCCTWDAGAGTSLWLDALNWSSDLLPGAGDLVVIDLGGTVTLGSGTVGVAGLTIGNGSTLDIAGGIFSVSGTTTLDGTLGISAGSATLSGPLIGGSSGQVNITGGTLNLNGLVSTIYHLNLIAGTLNTGGSGTGLTVANQFSWDHGTISGGGNFTVTGDASFANNTPGANAMLLSNQAMTIDGNLAIAGQYWLDMNGGELTVNGATTVDTSAAPGFYGIIGASSLDTVQFLGGLSKTAGTEAYVLANLNLTQGGTVSNLAGGELVFDLGSGSATLDNTSFVAAAGRQIKLASGNYNVIGNATFSGAGTTQIGNADTRTPVFTTAVGNTLTNNGTLVITSNATLANAGTLINNGTLTSTPDLTLSSGGIYQGSGTLIGNLVNAGGTVGPGNSPGTMNISGNYTQDINGTLLMELGGTAQGVDFDWLNVSGSATLDGTLQVTLLGGFVPAAGNVFTLVSAGGGVSGTFESVNLPAFPLTPSYGALAFSLAMPATTIVPVAPTTTLPSALTNTLALLDTTVNLAALSHQTPLLYSSGQSGPTASGSGALTQTAETVLPAWVPPAAENTPDETGLSASTTAVMPLFTQLIDATSRQEPNHESRLTCR